MDLFNFFLLYFLLSILSIPTSIIFKKAGANYLNAFIPFKNIVSYLKVVGIKEKYFYSLIVMLAIVLAILSIYILFFYLLHFDSGILPLYKSIFQFLLGCFFLLLLIPTYMIIFVILGFIIGISHFFVYFIGFIRSGNGAFGFILTPLVLSISVFLAIFYCKISYKLPLRFGWNRKFAILYVIFQPIAVWILAFGKWKYISNCDVVSLSKNNIINGGNQINANSGVVSNNLNNENGNGILLSGISTQGDKQFYEEMKNFMLKFGKLILWFILYFIFSFLFLSFLLWAFMIFRILILKYF